jgi:probable HAF family extracellular repeat protein
MRTLSKLSLIAAAALTTATAFADLTDIHPLTGYSTVYTYPLGVSGDGLTVYGITYNGQSLAFKMVGTNLTPLDNLLGGTDAWAYAASANGTLVVGMALDNSGVEQAVFWPNTTPTLLDQGSIFYSSSATGVSANGGTIVGSGFDLVTNLDQAFYHRSNTLTPFGATAFGADASRAKAVSADGNLVVGTSTNDFYAATASAGFIYNITTNTSDAVGNTSGHAFTQLTGISGDGTAVIGYGSTSLNNNASERAFKYVPGAGGSFTPLGALSVGGWSIPRAINNDGSVIVGQSENGFGDGEAFVFQNGAMTGLGFLTGGSTSDATGVSADGTVIVGNSGTTSGYYHAFVYANQTMLDADAWLLSLNGPGSVLAMTANLNLLALEGAHHRPLMSYDNMGKQSQAWATGDFGTSSRQVDQHKTSGEFGVSQACGDFVFGLAVGHASVNQDLLFGGNAHISGNTLLLEADYRLADKESIVSLVLMRGDWDAEANRGYETGGGTDTSNGRTDVTTSSVRLRLDGPAQKFVSAVSATPFASFTVTRTSADAYTETTGSFPATFGDQAHTAQEGRLGVTAKYVASPSTTLLFTAEWIHRFDGAGAGLTATSATMGTLTAAGVAPTKDQARFGFEVDQKLSADTLLNLSFHAAGNGPSSDFAAALSIRRAF